MARVEPFSFLADLFQRPPIFGEYTVDRLWQDEHISQRMLDFHLDDSPNYGSYFVGKTVFLLQKNPERQAAWMRLAGRI